MRATSTSSELTPCTTARVLSPGVLASNALTARWVEAAGVTAWYNALSGAQKGQLLLFLDSL
jgi:hypothetical protein